jgi:BspA type Leucine rich repeat region (6 copies)
MKTLIPNLFLALAWLALPTLAQAQFSFTTNNGAITITGYNTAAGLNMVIPAATNGYPVTSIGGFVFDGSSITNATIPNSVTSIGVDAFVFCPSLMNFTVDPSNPAYSSLGGVLFDKAKATLIQFPAGLGGNYVITNSVTSIDGNAFSSCTNLTSVTISNSVISIGGAAFSDCTSLASAAIGNGVTSIGDDAFNGCNSLTNVTIGTNVTSIGVGVFMACYNLTSVTIPGRVTSIGQYAFTYCSSLTNIAVAASNPAYSSLGGVLFDKAGATLIEFPPGLGGGYLITNGVTAIAEGAFEDCDYLTSVTFPASVTSIGDYAFADCISLKSAYFLGNGPDNDDDAPAFVGDSATVYYLSGTTGWYPNFGGVSTMLWKPQAHAVGITGGHFGFNLTGPASAVVVVETCTNLSNPVWLPIATNTIPSNSTSAFSDLQSGAHPTRFYRERSP